MTTKTELETAKEWWNNLSIGEQYKLTLKLNELKDFDSNILSFYQEEVLKNTSYFESPVSPIYSDSEVMDKQPQTSQPNSIGKLKEEIYKELIEETKDMHHEYIRGYIIEQLDILKNGI